MSIEISNVRKAFGNSIVLAGLNLSIPTGQLVAVIGPSGCGKSTLLRLIAGLLACDSGTIRLEDKLVSASSPHLLDTGMVFQDLALYPHFTIHKNLRFALRKQNLPKTEIDARVDRIAEHLSISQLLGRYPADLSGGERQRVAIGRAMIRQPKVLLLDEPLSQLDAHLRTRLRNLLVDMHQRLGCTTLYVTHDANDAFGIADRILVMKDGQIVQDGIPEQIYSNPKDRWIAEFVGEPPINFVTGSLDGDKLRIGHCNLTLQHPSSSYSPQSDSREVLVGFRPGSVRLSIDSASVENTFQYNVRLKRSYRRDDGFVTIVESEFGQHHMLSSSKLATNIESDLVLSVSTGELIIFDAQTRNNLFYSPNDDKTN